MNRRQLLAFPLCSGLSAIGQGAGAAMGEIESLGQPFNPPFVNGANSGLTYELKSWLQDELGLSSRVELMPRFRIVTRVDSANWRGYVPWVSPVWYNDVLRQRFHWSEPLMIDEDLVLLRPGLELDYHGANSLSGLTIGTTLGHRYADLESEIKAGRIRRSDSRNHESTLRMLMLSRVDVAFLSRSSIPWWNQYLPGLMATVGTASQPRMRFERRALLSAHMPASIRQDLVRGLNGLASSPSWHKRLAAHGLDAKSFLPPAA